MNTIRINLDNSSYRVHVGSNLLEETGRLLGECGFSGRTVIVSDPQIKDLHGDRLTQALASSGFDAQFIVIPPGEKEKSLAAAGRLYRHLNRLGVERTTPLLALGGGVIGDLAGFVAATYMRGIPLVQVPTTLLAQADSSIGGKVAVNHGNLKNMVGTFYHPKLTISDVNLLKTLSAREISGGLSEIIKHAMILDREFFEYLEYNVEKARALDEVVLGNIVFRSGQIKASVVQQDELDLGYRNVLNYGHTVGHAIESASGLGIWHGEAVALGMMAEARIANMISLLSTEDLMRLKRLISKAGLPTEPPRLRVDRMKEAMRSDKKVQRGRLRFALPKAIGAVCIVDEVDYSLVENVIGGCHEKA